MKSVRQPFTFDRVIRILFTVVAIVAVFYLIGLLKNALLPFLVAWLLAYLINPFVEFIQYRCRVKIRIISIFLALLSVIPSSTIIASLNCLFLTRLAAATIL